MPLRSAAGERLGGFVYGTIVALAVLVGGARAYPAHAWKGAALVAAAAGLLWLAHVYAHWLGESVARRDYLRLAELRHIARHEISIVLAALPLIGALLLGAVGLVSANASYWLAFALGLAVLGLLGIRFARIERLGVPATVAFVAVNCGFELGLIWLKLLIVHH